MTRWGLIGAGTLVFVAVASQLLVPELGERRIESRLTEAGGSAEVTLGAVPAVRLLFADGERFQVTGSGLALDADRSEPVFDDLDGFSMVDVSISDSTAGPFELSNFELSRDGEGPYRLVATGAASTTSLAEFGLESAEVPGESLLDVLLDPLLDDSDTSVPVDLDLELSSDDGRVQVVSGGGTVAGFDAAPLAELITAAVVVRL